MKPARYIAEARAKGIPVDEKLKKCMKRQLTRLRNKSVGLINGQGNNWGGIAAVLESYKKENIFNFTQHSMYLLGIDCRPEDDSLVAVLTTENLLLNAYRQQFWGNPICILQTDTRRKRGFPNYYNQLGSTNKNDCIWSDKP